MAGGSLSPIYNNMNGVAPYHPFEADTYADWSLEAGDIVTVSRGGTSYSSPVHSASLVWRGQPEMHISSTGKEKRDPISKVSMKKYASRGGGMWNNQSLYWEMYSDDGQFHSVLEATSSRLSARMEDFYNGLYSYIEFTASRLYTEFVGLYDGLSSHFEITRSRMYADFMGLYDGLSSQFEVTRSRMYVDFMGLYDGLSSTFEVTRSRMYADFYGLYDGLSSTFEVTRSRMYADFQGMYDGLSSSFEVTRSRMYVDFHGMYDGLSSTFEVTRSRMYVDFHGMYDGLSSTFEVTRSRMYVAFQGMYDGLSSTFEVTRSRMYVDFTGLYDGLNSSFEVTRSRMRAEFAGLYDGLKSSFEVTRSRMYVDFSGFYDGLSSTFEVTRSRMYVAFNDAYNGLSSEFIRTASRWTSQFNDTYNNLSSRIDQEAGKISLVVEGTGPNAHIKPAAIQAGINAATGQSKILLSADHIVLDGEAVANSLKTEELTVSSIDAQDGQSVFQDFYVANEDEGGVGWYSTDVCIGASVDEKTNTLTLEFADGSSVDFSKAASQVTLTGEWSGTGTLTVSSNPAAVSNYIANITHSLPYIDTSTNKWRMDIQYYGTGTPPTYYDTGHWVNLDNYLDKRFDGSSSTKKITANGTYDPNGSNLIGLSKVVVDVPDRYNTGWTDAAGKINTPSSASTGNTLTISGPDASNPGASQPVTYRFYTPDAGIESGTPYAYIKTGTTIVAKRSISSLLTSKTYTSNVSGDTPGSSYIGFSSITVDVHPTLSGLWSGQTLTLTSSPSAVSNYTVTFDTSSASTTQKTVLEITGNGTPSKSSTEGYITVPVKVQQVYSGSAPVSRKTTDISVKASGLLDDRFDGSTSAKKITSNDTYTPGSGFIGFSSVKVEVPSSSGYINALWSNNTFSYQITTDSSYPTSGSVTVNPFFDSYSSGGTTYYRIAINSTSGSGSTTTITSGGVDYKLGTSGTKANTVVQIQNLSGARINNTATLDVGNLYTTGKTDGAADEKGLVRTRFSSGSGNYYVEAYENTSGNPSISGTSTTYKLGTTGSYSSTKVQIQNTSGTRLSNTPELSVGSLFTDGENSALSAFENGFGTTAPSGASNSGYTNNSSGYQILSTGSSGEAVIVVRGAFNYSGLSRYAYNYLYAAPTALYRKGYSDGQSAGSHSVANFGTTAPGGATYGSYTNNSDGYSVSGSGSSATAAIVVRADWTCGGTSQNGTSYLSYAPTALYRAAYSAGYTAGGGGGGSTINNARSRFGSASTGYYIEAYDGTTGNSVSGSSVNYQIKGIYDSSRGGGYIQIHDKSSPSARIANTYETNVWLVTANQKNHQGTLAYDTVYGITVGNDIIATWKTPEATSHSVSLSVDMKWTGSVSGYESKGSYSASELARTYIRISASCGGSTKKWYYTIN